MNFVRVNNKLANEENSLSVVPLKILQPLRDTYDALLVQPLGTMQATEQHIRHADQDSAIKLYKDLLNKASEHAVDLTVTPEYCLPWQILEEISETALNPKQGALWVLGCESITLDALEDFKTRRSLEGIKVIYEVPEAQNKDFLCPLVYVFWVEDAVNEMKLCMLIQFKTVPSGGDFEVDHLYLGNNIYIFGNEGNGLNFFSLICADVFELTDSQIETYHKNSLITHIQLNEKPWHTDFAKYRNRLFSIGSNSNVELMCLNWATGLSWDNNGDQTNIKTWKYVANSAFYIPKKISHKTTDAELDALHKKGIYYNKVHDFWDSFFFNNAAQAILIKKQPIRFDGEQALALPWKLQYIKRFVPNKGNIAWIEANIVNDGFTNLLAEYKPTTLALQEGFDRFDDNMKSTHDTSPLAVERSLELLQGPVGKSSSWYHREELLALKVASEESPRRVTTHQEKCTTRDGVEFRKRRVKASYDAATLYTQKLNWPMPLKDIGKGFKYYWHISHPHCNVIPIQKTDNPATLIYLDVCTPGEHELHYDKLHKALRDHIYSTTGSNDKELIKNLVRAKDRLCVVYSEHHKYKFHHVSDGKKSITSPANQSSTSFDADDGKE